MKWTPLGEMDLTRSLPDPGGGRIFISSLTLRTAHPEYQWVNTLFAVVEGELQGAPRPNEFRAHCRAYACEATITPISRGGDQSMPVRAYALPVTPGKDRELDAFVRELASRAAEYSAYRRQLGITREAAFLQRTPQGSQVIIYRELNIWPRSQPPVKSPFEDWLAQRLSAVHGFDPTEAPPKIELLIRQRPARPGKIYTAALPVMPNKSARLHEWSAELNGIHADEFVESLRRLGFGLTLFVQYTPEVDLVISVVEGDDPAKALGRLASSTHPFDRWHVQQIADQTGIDFSTPPPPPNEQLWSWDDAARLALAHSDAPKRSHTT